MSNQCTVRRDRLSSGVNAITGIARREQSSRERNYSDEHKFRLTWFRLSLSLSLHGLCQQEASNVMRFFNVFSPINLFLSSKHDQLRECAVDRLLGRRFLPCVSSLTGRVLRQGKRTGVSSPSLLTTTYADNDLCPCTSRENTTVMI